MKIYRSSVVVLFVLAGVSSTVGTIAKATGFVVLGLVPLSYLRFIHSDMNHHEVCHSRGACPGGL